MLRGPDEEEEAETVWPVPDAAITITCAHDGWSNHPKHVEQFTQI